eukprot:366412-Chlamydomonas_euryale.AAC.5
MRGALRRGDFPKAWLLRRDLQTNRPCADGHTANSVSIFLHWLPSPAAPRPRSSTEPKRRVRANLVSSTGDDDSIPRVCGVGPSWPNCCTNPAGQQLAAAALKRLLGSRRRLPHSASTRQAVDPLASARRYRGRGRRLRRWPRWHQRQAAAAFSATLGNDPRACA